MQAGDKLVLSKGLGTGTIMAADMRARAKSQWVAGTLQSMLLSNHKAAQILHQYKARACTDVTGFGLLGHLVEMVKATNHRKRAATTTTGTVQCHIILEQVPALDGAIECIQQGIFSSLQEDNFRLRYSLSDESDTGLGNNPRYHLIFDPQTAGGLLASVPAEMASAVVEKLRGEGYQDACIVGEVRETSQGASGDTPIVLHLRQTKQ